MRTPINRLWLLLIPFLVGSCYVPPIKKLRDTQWMIEPNPVLLNDNMASFRVQIDYPQFSLHRMDSVVFSFYVEDAQQRVEIAHISDVPELSKRDPVKRISRQVDFLWESQQDTSSVLLQYRVYKRARYQEGDPISLGSIINPNLNISGPNR